MTLLVFVLLWGNKKSFLIPISMKKSLSMKNSRRQFINDSLKFSALCLLASTPIYFSSCNSSEKKSKESEKKKALNILILGGTSFLGPHQIAYALERGHKISIFTRGKTKPTIHADAFDKVEHLIGDRKNNLEALKGKKWDVVVDNSGHDVKWAEDSAKLLKDNVGMYVFTSSTGVYYPYLTAGITEEQELVMEVPEDIDENQSLEYGYGVMKSNSERVIKETFGADRSLMVRPTYMMGPGDRTDRFTYWPVRMAMGGEVAVPGNPDDQVQYIDVRDVAEWMIRLIEENRTGTFNAVGPKTKTGMLDFVKEVQSAFDVQSTLTVIDDYEFLKANKVWYAIPWIMVEGENYGSAMISNALALENGLTYRSLPISITDIYNWWQTDAVNNERKERMIAGENSLMRKEKELIKAWKSRM
jgi:2'-hydroxyisoflavone reductase